ncbi:hypothetical protein N7U49_47170 [Streptomyces sp. AD2-2]|nr:hypothetical protein N7U49_47170 [Streptomyces sp. AD2-2]
MTTVHDDVSWLPADPSLVGLVYHHEHPLQASEAQHREAAATLGRMCSAISFEHFPDGVYLLDCNLQRPQDLLTERQEEFTALCSAWRRTRTLP